MTEEQQMMCEWPYSKLAEIEARLKDAERERDFYRDGLQARQAELDALKMWVNDKLSGLPGNAAACIEAAGRGLPGK